MKALLIRIVEMLKKYPLLAGILGLGFVLRIWGLFWGTPFLGSFEGYYHPDEWNIVQGAIKFPQHVVDNRWFVYPTFFHHFLGILTFPLRPFFDDFGFPSPEALGSTFYWVVTVVGRLCSVLAGMGAIVFTYLLAKDVFDQRRALLSSAFLAFTFLHAMNSTVVTPDVLTSFFLVLFLFVLRRAFLKPESVSLFVSSGIILGLLVGTKYTGAVALGAVVVLYGSIMIVQLRYPDTSVRLDQRTFHRNLLLGGGVSLVTFLLTTPGILLYFDAFQESMNHVTRAIGWKSGPRSDPETWVTVFNKFERGIGWPLAYLFLFGVLFPYKKNVHEWSFIAILGLFFVYFEAKLISRYIILVAPLIAIIASHAVLWICESVRKPIQILGYSLIILVLGYSIGLSATGRYLRVDDLRTQAAQYIHNKYPKATTLGLAYTRKGSSWRTHTWKAPRIDFSHFREMDIFDYPEVVVISSLVKLKKIKEALLSDKLSADFVWDSRYNDEWWRSTPPSPKMFEFYHGLFDDSGGSRYRLMKTFKKKVAVWLEHTPPQIDIYVRQSYGPHTERRSYYPSNPREYFLEEDMRKRRWQLRVEKGSKATLKFPSDDPTAVQIAIGRVDTGRPWAVQLNQESVAIKNNQAYVLGFRIRADAARSVTVAVGQTAAPWQTVGLYQPVPVTEDWQEHALAFRAEDDEPQARVYFDLGTSAVPVEIAEVQLRHQSDLVLAGLNGGKQEGAAGQDIVEPDLPDKYYVDYRFNTMGCRGRDYSIPRVHAGTRILVLGDSLALGAGVHQEGTMTTQLEGLLNRSQDPNPPGSNFEVINCGVGGYGTQDAVRFYEEHGKKYAPDIVLLVMAPDDDQALLEDIERENFSRLKDPHSSFVAWSSQQEKLFNRLAPNYSESLNEAKHLQHVVEGQGGKFVVVAFRHTRHQSWNHLIQQLTASFHGTAVPVLDLGESLLSTHSEDELTVHKLDRHPNEVAHKLAARNLGDFLYKNGLLKKQTIARLASDMSVSLH